MSTPPTPRFEERLARLENIVSQLEDDSLALDKHVQLYKEGLLLAKACQKQLDEARLDVQTYSASDPLSDTLSPFDAVGLADTSNHEDAS